jgi:hypothetical protein
MGPWIHTGKSLEKVIGLTIGQLYLGFSGFLVLVYGLNVSFFWVPGSCFMLAPVPVWLQLSGFLTMTLGRTDTKSLPSIYEYRAVRT